MSRHLDPTAVRRALAQRLGAVAATLLPDRVPGLEGDAASDAAELLADLVEHARSTDDAAATWLLLVGLTGAFPSDATIRTARRRLVQEPAGESMMWLLDQALTSFRTSDPLVELEVVADGVVVDVDYSARHDLNTGIQRVVRSTVPLWAREHELTLVAWTSWHAMRRLEPLERQRVLSWSGPLGAQQQFPEVTRVVVPWRSVVVLPEVPAPHLCAPLAALAEHSGNSVSAIGYDCIPVVSADLMPRLEPDRFVRYLTIVKHAHRIAGISASAAEEFRGFTDMLPSQGLTGPGVTECLLPVEIPADVTTTPTEPSPTPRVVVVGSHEPRKNHLAVLHAVEVLWREGLRFSVRFIGGSSWASAPFDKKVKEMQKRGRDVALGRAVGDGELWDAYRTARFSVFPSVHEGFGLPVAESLAIGTPAITSDFGSTLEIGKEGGTLLVDPRDDASLIDAMRRLLVDDELHAELVAQARAREPRTWEDYARELWDQLVLTVRDKQGSAA